MPESSSRAPFIIFGGILLIAICTVTVVIVGHVLREEPYPDSIIIKDPVRMKMPYRPAVSRMDAGARSEPR